MGKVVKNALGYESKLFVYQDKKMFNYSIDTILLANFVTINKNTNYGLEVGTNNGALAIFLTERSPKLKINAVEIIEDAIKLAKKNIKLNNKEQQIHLIHQDFKKLVVEENKRQAKKYDFIICNPPFYKTENFLRRKGSDYLYSATHEVNLTLEELIAKSAKIIKQKGYLAIVIPTERIVDTFEYMRRYGFEPKRVQMIYPRIHSKSNLILVEGRFQVGWGVHFLKNIYLHDEDLSKHGYREEIKALYKPIRLVDSYK